MYAQIKNDHHALNRGAYRRMELTQHKNKRIDPLHMEARIVMHLILCYMLLRLRKQRQLQP